jgi:hypothetical protein
VRRGRDERGSTIPVLIGLALVIAILIAVVTDATAAYLRRQSLDSLADGAALQGADLGARGLEVYTGELTGDRLRETEGAATEAVTRYLRAVGAYGRYPGLRAVVRVDPQSRAVEVSLTTSVDLPLGVPGVTRRAQVTSHGSASVVRDID